MQIVWTRAALSNLEEIADYIARDSPIAAHRLAVEMTTRTASILAGNPLAGRIGRARGTRELILHNLPYIVAYRVTDRVEILAIVHAAQRWPTTID